MFNFTSKYRKAMELTGSEPERKREGLHLTS
jgi:hypothetical protein